MRGRRHFLLAAGALAAVVVGTSCTEDAIIGPPGEGIEEPTATIEVSLSADEFLRWRDTTFTGFALPTDVGFTLAAETDDLRARTLLRYGTVPDSVTVDSVRLAVDAYEDAELRFVLDSAGSRVPEGGFLLRLRGLERGYDAEEVTWQQADEAEPWATPGGDLGPELGSLDLTGVPDSLVGDTLVVPVEGVSDSLLSDWASRDGGEGAALLVEGEGANLRLRSATLRFGVRPSGRDTVVALDIVPFLGTASPITFIYDPPQPDPGSGLRLGGLPASRYYLEFLPPDTVDGVALTGGTINRAEIVFRPLETPVQPFPFESAPTVSIVDLAGDPFAVGPKTPIGGTLEDGTRTVAPDSLAAGVPVRFDFTSLMTRWAAAPDSFETFTVAVRLQPDGQTLGFWDFGSVEAPAALRPFVRIVLTPPSNFDVP